MDTQPLTGIEIRTQAIGLLQKDAITLPADAAARKQEALEKAKPIVAVTNQEENLLAVNAMRSIKAVTKYAEDSRQEFKAPILELGRKIDQTAKDFVADLNTQFDRIDKLSTAFSKAEIEKAKKEAAEAEYRQEMERRRIAEEQRKAADIEAARQAEVRRLETEARNAEIAAKWASTAPEREAAARAKLENEQRLAEENRRLNEERARNLQLQADSIKASAPVVVAQVKVPGQTVKETWKFRVTNVYMLANSSPDLVTIEPRTQDINRRIAAGERTIPGLEIYSEIATQYRP